MSIHTSLMNYITKEKFKNVYRKYAVVEKCTKCKGNVFVIYHIHGQLLLVCANPKCDRVFVG